MNLKSLKLKLVLLAVVALFAVSCEHENIQPVETAQSDESFINQEAAVKLAANILFKPDPTAKSQNSLKRDVSSVKAVKENGGENLFYIINYKNGGFVIVAADNRLSPILAFSETSVFKTDANDYPSGLVGWMTATRDTIKKIRKSDLAQSGALKKEWSSFAKDRMISLGSSVTGGTAKPIEPTNPNNCQEDYESVGPLLKTTWHQGCGFNDLLPAMDCTGSSYCNKALVGCVPLAIAQVMKYHAYPASYNWANMPNAYATASTAALIKDIHTSIGSVTYKCDATSVNKDYNTAGVFTRFGYSAASSAGYNSETVKQQLRIGKPVILSGGTSDNFLFFEYRTGGHMWVCDGFMWSKYCIFDDNGNYQSSGTTLYLSMNWGWGGYENGWYAYNNFNPAGSTYNYQIKMVYNITP